MSNYISNATVDTGEVAPATVIEAGRFITGDRTNNRTSARPYITKANASDIVEGVSRQPSVNTSSTGTGTDEIDSIEYVLPSGATLVPVEAGGIIKQNDMVKSDANGRAVVTTTASERVGFAREATKEQTTAADAVGEPIVINFTGPVA